MASLDDSFCADGLPVGDLGTADLGGDVEFAAQAVGHDFQVELPHSGNDHLAAIRVGMEAEGGVLARERIEGFDELHFFGLGFSLE